MTDRTLSMSTKPIPSEPMVGDDKTWEHDSWEITLTFQGRTMTLKFHTGIGLREHGSPTIGAILSAVASDASGVINARSFADWANEYGYDTNSRRAEATYKAVVQQTAELRELLGDWLEIVIFEPPDDGDWSELEGTSVELPPRKDS